MTSFFSLSLDRSLIVKSVTSASRGGKATIKIEIETADFDELAYALRSLNELQAAQAQPKAGKKPRLLALPAPSVGGP